MSIIICTLLATTYEVHRIAVWLPARIAAQRENHTNWYLPPEIEMMFYPWKNNDSDPICTRFGEALEIGPPTEMTQALL